MTTQTQTQTPPLQRQTLDRAYLYKAMAAQSGLPATMLRKEAYEQLVDNTVTELQNRLFGENAPLSRLGSILKNRIAERFIGWEESIRTLIPTWDRRPIASFLLLGPTGTGKTETAKLVANLLFGGHLIALNGSEVGPDQPHGASMWVGSPPGYVGSDRGGILTNGLRAQHSGVILIDELEKADRSAVQNILLPLMGEGTVTDKNTGDTLYATDYIIFCTSNLQVETRRFHALGFGADVDSKEEPSETALFAALAERLLPEVLGRFNGMLQYEAMDIEAQWKLWSKLRHELAQRIGLGTRIVLDEEARRFIQQRFHDLETGARGIQDLFREQVVPLSISAEPGTTLAIGLRDNQLFRKPDTHDQQGLSQANEVSRDCPQDTKENEDCIKET